MTKARLEPEAEPKAEKQKRDEGDQLRDKKRRYKANPLDQGRGSQKSRIKRIGIGLNRGDKTS